MDANEKSLQGSGSIDCLLQSMRGVRLLGLCWHFVQVQFAHQKRSVCCCQSKPLARVLGATIRELMSESNEASRRQKHDHWVGLEINLQLFAVWFVVENYLW